MNAKLGKKLGETNRLANEKLPFRPDKAGVLKARDAVEETLSNPTAVSKPFTTSGGDLAVDVYSVETGLTVRIRSTGEFDTLMLGKTARLNPSDR